VPSAIVTRELLAPPVDVWAFVAEPHHFPDWWPGVAAVEPDRRGAAAGARWQVRPAAAGWLRGRDAVDTLVVLAAEVNRRLAFELIRARIRAELVITPAAAGHSHAELSIERPWLTGSPRRLAADALIRLYALCQTAAEI
jgi:uncharacterized protein YndB with AHSA1/START domain